MLSQKTLVFAPTGPNPGFRLEKGGLLTQKDLQPWEAEMWSAGRLHPGPGTGWPERPSGPECTRTGVEPEEPGFCFNWPKPRFPARERGFGPEELIYVATGPDAQTQVFGSRKGVCLRGLGRLRGSLGGEGCCELLLR